MLSDVIAALATPAGRSAIAMLRVSGKGAHDVASSVLQPFQLEPERRARLAGVVHPATGEILDQAVYTTFKAPLSYTGEDMVEISTHGGLLVPAEVLGALLGAGARPAEAGEFTRRALQHGKIDLLQAEAVADLTAATAPAQRRAALNQLDQGLSRLIGDLRSQVLDLEALCCYEIDFPDEDSGPVPPGRVDEAARQVEVSLETLLNTAGEGRRLTEGALCVIAGRPNTGKSSLFNALLGSDRAIVTDTPGTTRDAIEAPATCEGFPFRLVDTAGLRDSQDTVERLGVEVSHRYLNAADVVLFCVEAGRELSDEEAAFLRGVEAPTVVARTKVDLVDLASADEVLVSAKTGVGIDRIRARLAQVAFSQLGSSGDVQILVTRERHRSALKLALREVAEFRAGWGGALDSAVTATHLRAAVSALDDVIGLVTTEDVLDRVFASFCVGK